MILWLASYPRSGNTFFRILLQSLYGVGSYSIYGDRVLGSNPSIALTTGHRVLEQPLTEVAEDAAVYVVKTHDLPADDAYPAIYVVRDGRDALVSYARYILTFERNDYRWDENAAPFYHTLRDLIVHNQSFGGWSRHVASWSKRARTVVIRFEDLLSDPHGEVERALTGVDCRLPRIATAVPSFSDLHAEFPQFFRRGEPGAWKTEMPADLQSLFWNKHREAMTMLGYSS